MRRSQLAVLLLVAACGAPRSPEPEGAWWVGERAAVETLLGQLEQLAGTPLATGAAQWRAALPADCALVGAHAPDGALAALSQIRCVESSEALGRVWRRSSAEGDAAAIAFGRRHPEHGDVGGALRVGTGELSLSLDWAGSEAAGALALLVPGERPAGPDHLAGDGRLLHARVRPAGGLDLAALVPAESQGDRLFRLRSGLFAGAVLDGTWELAVYEPEREGALPAAAVSLGVRSQPLAAAAAQRMLGELSQTWAVQASPFERAGGRGACLLELALLPELAPCYVTLPGALVLGWNPRALERALPEPAAAQPTGPGPGSAAARLELDFERVARSDSRAARRLAELQGVEAPVLDWPWRRLSAQATRRRGALRVEAELAAREGV